MVSEKNLASSIGGKTARACDSCIKKRARWYCPADDAFLCQTCDNSVHSANLLAQRHQRVRLKTALEKHSISLEPSWHHGFTRKARTPRQGKNINPRAAKSKSNTTQRNQTHPLVPDNENSYEENEQREQPLLYHLVPVLEPFHGNQLCFSGTSNECATTDSGEDNGNIDDKCKLGMVNSNDNIVTSSSLHEFYSQPCSMHHHDLDQELAVDVQSLLGKGQDDDDMETLGFLVCREKESIESCSRSTAGCVKKEEVEGGSLENINNDDEEVYMRKDTFDQLNLDDYDFQVTCEEDNNCGIHVNILEREEVKVKKEEENKNKILLALDYEGVITAWADQKSPWTNGDRPKLDPNDCWPDCMDGGTWSGGDKICGSNIGIGMTVMDGGREARVSRYREKRRTRLFSKKIRYEVRKLNAQKRPRIKGRFVKRPNFLTSPGL